MRKLAVLAAGRHHHDPVVDIRQDHLLVCHVQLLHFGQPQRQGLLRKARRMLLLLRYIFGHSFDIIWCVCFAAAHHFFFSFSRRHRVCCFFTQTNTLFVRFRARRMQRLYVGGLRDGTRIGLRHVVLHLALAFLELQLDG